MFSLLAEQNARMLESHLRFAVRVVSPVRRERERGGDESI